MAGPWQNANGPFTRLPELVCLRTAGPLTQCPGYIGNGGRDGFAARLAGGDGGIEDGEAKIDVVDGPRDASSGLLWPTCQQRQQPFRNMLCAVLVCRCLRQQHTWAGLRVTPGQLRRIPRTGSTAVTGGWIITETDARPLAASAGSRAFSPQLPGAPAAIDYTGKKKNALNAPNPVLSIKSIFERLKHAASPGQSAVLHLWICVSPPAHALPPLAGLGLSHVL